MVPAAFPGWSDRSQCTPTTYLPCTVHGHDATRGNFSSPSRKAAYPLLRAVLRDGPGAAPGFLRARAFRAVSAFAQGFADLGIPVNLNMFLILAILFASPNCPSTALWRTVAWQDCQSRAAAHAR